MIAPGLGTAQLGIPYGAYADGEVMSASQAHGILERAFDHGITFYDTARAYGESERRLGTFLKSLAEPQDVLVCTKMPRVSEEIWGSPSSLQAAMRMAIGESWELLGDTCQRMVLLHQSEVSFLSSIQVRDAIQELQERNPCCRFGVSVYNLEEAWCALEQPWVSALQFPVNLIDRRFVRGDFVESCRQKRILRIARSVFLQGVLTSETPIPMVMKRTVLEELRDTLQRSIGLEPLEQVAIHFVFGNCGLELDVALLGVHSLEELERNLDMIQRVRALPQHVIRQIENMDSFVQDNQLYDPRTWNA